MNYQNKYFSILGDSISTLEGYSQPREAAFYSGERKLKSGVFTPSDTWWGQVIERLGGQLLGEEYTYTYRGNYKNKQKSSLSTKIR